ncbi:MAG: transglutaminase domain-containing protein [Ktedonobacterales bacterium]
MMSDRSERATATLAAVTSNQTARNTTRDSASRSLDIILWLLLALLVLPLAVALDATTWAQQFYPWTLPTLIALGAGLGVTLTVAPLRRRWWLALLAVVVSLGVAGGLGALVVAHGARALDLPTSLTPGVATGALLLGAYTTTLVAILPWLSFRARQGWLAVGVIWVSVAGAWGAALLDLRQLFWLIWLLAFSLAFLGLSRLREELRLWLAVRLERIGPALWPSARSVVAISLLVALLGLAPVGALRLLALASAWQHTSLGQGGPLSYDTSLGAPVSEPGAPLALDAPDVGGTKVILRYMITYGPVSAPPLLAATLDTFDGASNTWRQSANTTSLPVKANATLAAPSGAQVTQAKITLVTLTQIGAATFLPSFTQPLSFSVPSQARVLSGAGAASGVTPDPLLVADWETSGAVTSGLSYSTQSAALPPTVVGKGVLPAALVSSLTVTPDTLAATLSDTAHTWLHTSSGSGAAQPTPTALAQMLLTVFGQRMTLNPQLRVPKGQNPILWTLQQKQGNALLLTTTYILLGRALGLPLRLAEGYLPGLFDIQTKSNVVRASDATVWAQLAVPGAGWLDLLPASNVLKIVTPSKIIYRHLQQTPTPQPTGSVTASPQHTPQTSRSPHPDASGGPTGGALALTIAALLALLVVLTGLAAVGLIGLRWSRLGVQLPALQRFFVRLATLARLAGIRLRASDTSA